MPVIVTLLVICLFAGTAALITDAGSTVADYDNRQVIIYRDYQNTGTCVVVVLCPSVLRTDGHKADSTFQVQHLPLECAAA